VLCPTGDTALDNTPAKREAMLDGIGQAWQNSDPNNPNTAARRERGGAEYHDPTSGKYSYTLFPDQGQPDTPCSNYSTPQPATNIADRFHTHPFAPGDLTPQVCWPAGQAGPFAYDITKFGGPSKEDWCAAINDGVTHYILDKNNLYVADPTGLTCADSSQFRQHARRYKRFNGSCQIVWRGGERNGLERGVRRTAFNVG
jgi:hypothetical protein